MTSEPEIYDRIKDDVLKGTLKPGERLIVATLRERYGAGTSPIREALSRLLAAGFLALEPNKGYTVAPISESDLHDLVESRCVIEEAALRLAIRNGDEAWAEQVLVTHFRLERTSRLISGADEINPKWEQYHNSFHDSLLAGSGLKWLNGRCAQLREFYLRYTRLTVQAGLAAAKLDQQHRDIRDACIDRDEDRAAELLKQHYRDTKQYVLQALASSQQKGDAPSRKASARS